MLTLLVEQFRRTRSLTITDEFMADGLWVSPEELASALSEAASPEDELKSFHDDMRNATTFALIGPAERAAMAAQLRAALEDVLP
jgi:hypothetical protein